MRRWNKIWWFPPCFPHPLSPVPAPQFFQFDSFLREVRVCGPWRTKMTRCKQPSPQSPLSHVWCIKYIPILGPGVVQISQLSSRWISLTILSESQRYVHIPMWPILSPHHPKKTSQNIMDKSISSHISHIMSSLFNHFQGGSPWILRAWLALWPSTALRVDGSPEPHGNLPHGPQRSCRGVVGWDAHGNPQVPEPVPMASACYTAWWYT
jgi:hypothetical protein